MNAQDLYYPLIDVGVPSFAFTVALGITIAVLKFVFGRFQSIFYTLYLVMLCTDCLSYIFSYIRYRLPTKFLWMDFYKSFANSYVPHIVEFFFYFLQHAQCWALFYLVVYHSCSMMQINNQQFTKRKQWPMILVMLAIAATYGKAFAATARILIYPFKWSTQYVVSAVQSDMDKGIDWGLIAFVATFTSISSLVFLLLALICLRKRSYEADEFRRWVMLLVFACLQCLLAWNYIIYVVIGVTAMMANLQDKLKLLPWITSHGYNFPWIIDLCSVIKHWLFLLLNQDFLYTLANRKKNQVTNTVAIKRQ